MATDEVMVGKEKKAIKKGLRVRGPGRWLGVPEGWSGQAIGHPRLRVEAVGKPVIKAVLSGHGSWGNGIKKEPPGVREALSKYA
ncbi:hypothetical protein GCM10022406_23200 [Hymenobacter algoricola]|uniref:Uncharacterized protein n=1 Tax=Hymenobacter algoricola TaxID=486267 RepID=A0ABP7N6I7_9BACT